MHLIHTVFDLTAIAVAGINPNLSADERSALAARLAEVRANLTSIPAAELAVQGLSAGDIARLRADLTGAEAALS